MNNKIFSSGDYYDLFYENKDYELEAKYVHKKIQEYKSNSTSILELGCGTGKHAINLAKFGYPDYFSRYPDRSKIRIVKKYG